MKSLLRPLRQVKAPSSSHTIVSRLSSLANLHNELTTRKIPLSYDYLHPQPSHLLNLTLSDLLQTQTDQPPPTVLPSILNPSPLPIAHHLIYFPPQVSLSQLLPDGTDILHTPGDPFTRRLWAGGNIRFPGPASKPLLLDGSRAVCIESIRNVEIKGREGEEKVIVTIERRVGTVPEGEDELGSRERLYNQDKDESLDPLSRGQVSLIENRNLIFMRGKSGEQIAADKRDFENPSRIVKSPSNATFRQKIHPTEALLFRFSALTFNAHSIHLDKNYTQNEEGYRNCLVHGPLTLTLLLSVLQRHIEPLNLWVDHFEYRNLAPLFVGEDLTVCGKPTKSGETEQGEGSWDVWIEGPDGGLAVRGTAKTAKSY